MTVATAVDAAALRELVDGETLRRAMDYARRGAVLESSWQTGAEQVFGRVRGTARAPYTAIAALDTAADGSPIRFRGHCTCPVGVNCKHSLALLLSAAPAPTGATAIAPDTAPATAPWERALAVLVAAPEPTPAQPSIALQFALRGGRVGLRPVVPGKNGGWVRTGVSWSTVEQSGYGWGRRAPYDPAHVRLLAEVLAMDEGGSSSYYAANQTVYLDALRSRRIWDLLDEAGAAGLPLVRAGKASGPVVVRREPAVLTLDVRRNGKGLTLRPELDIAGTPVAADRVTLLGDPAHGIAWEPETDGELRLARLATPLDAALRAVVHGGELRIPARDADRFLAGYYPALRERLPVASGDASVDLPEPAPPVLCLCVRHLDERRTALSWHWAYQLADTAREEPLWAERGRGRDAAAEAAVLEPVTALAAALPGLCGPGADGERLAPAVTLDGIDTVRFSTEVLPRLSELPGVRVEQHGEPTRYRAADAAPRVEITGAEAEGERDWFDLSVAVTVDGEQVGFEALFVALASGESHLILPSGTYFSLDRQEFVALAELIAEARAVQEPGAATVRLSRYQASMWDELDRVGVMRGQAAQWQRSVRALVDGDGFADTTVPSTLQAVLRPYQRDGFGWLAWLHDNGLGGVLADEMGLGKTLQALALICRAKEAGTLDAPFLVVAPTSVASNWLSECQRFAPDLATRAVTQTQARRGCGLADAIAGADVVVTTYTLFRLEYERYAEQPWSGLVLDEAQFVKNHQSRGYQCAKRLPAPFKLAITGTPMENNLLELWSLLSITAPGLFANQSRFDQHFATPIEKGRDADRLAVLRRRVRPLLLRRSKEQVVRELPDKQEQVVELELNPRHRRIYQTHLQRERQKVLGLLGDLENNRFEIFRSLTLLRQASLDPSLIDPAYRGVPSTKLDVLVERVAEIAADGHRTLVFSQFTRFLSAAAGRLDHAGIGYCYLDGKTRDRAAVLAEFKGGDAPVFLISLKAGGFGLNLTEADYCILLDPWWNPATEAQAVDRVHRIGQHRKVMVFRLIAKDTIEEKVMALKAAKAALFGSVLDHGEFGSGALTAAEIRGMLE